MNIHERISEQVDLAKIYAEDGAFRTAGRVLRNLADELDAHDQATRLDPPPVVHGSAPGCQQIAEGDEYVCRTCTMRWDRSEDRPYCPKMKR